LELSARFVDGDSAANKDCEAILWPEAEELGLAAEEYDGKLRFLVLQGEVNMAGGGWATVGYLALDPDVLVLLFNLLTDAGDEVADAPDATFGGAHGAGNWLDR
jgi:hypothetical protein